MTQVKNLTLDDILKLISSQDVFSLMRILIKEGMWPTSQEAFSDWKTHKPVGSVHTANLAVYRIVKGKPVLDLLGREGNPFFDEQFQEEVYNDIRRNEFYFPRGAMKEHILAAIQPDLTVRYSGLHITNKKGYAHLDDGFTDYYVPHRHGYVESNGKNSEDEKKLFKKVYGTKNPGKGKRVSLLQRAVVRNQLRGNDGDVIVCLCAVTPEKNFIASYNDNFSPGPLTAFLKKYIEQERERQFRVAYKTVSDNIDHLSSSDTLSLYETLHPKIIAAARE